MRIRQARPETEVEGVADLTEPGVQLFAAAPDDARARRPVDAVRAVAWLFLLLLACTLSVIGRDLDHELGAVLRHFPPFLRTLWRVGFWGAVAWVAVLFVLIVVRRRFQLASEALIAGFLALGAAAFAGAIVMHDGVAVFRQLVHTDRPPVFPHGAIAVVCAMLATTAPYLTLPFRRLGRALIGLQVVGSLFLGATLASGAIAAVAIGLLAGSLLLLTYGSPSAFPTLSRVNAALHDLGVRVADLRAVTLGREGAALLAGTDESGPVQIKVYGRDAWDGEFLASAWRSAWYRDRQPTARGRRLEYVEHEGFVSMLARQAGAHAPAVITAGLADNGDALIVTRSDGTPVADRPNPLSLTQLDALWHELSVLHAAGISHNRVDFDRVLVGAEGTIGFGDLSSASVQCRPQDRREDCAQLLALTILNAGEETAVPAARAALGDAGLADALPYLQEAAMAPVVRSQLRSQHIELDAMRKRLGDALGAPEAELAHIRRVTWKSILSLVLFAVAAYTVVGMLSDVDLGSFSEALGHANWWWLAAALVLGQLPRVANAVSTMGSTSEEVPLGPTTLLQFAMCYLNLAVPGSAGRVAVTTRFFQRLGIPPGAAVSASIIDSISEVVVGAILFVLVFSISDVDLGLSTNTDELSGVATTVLIVLGVLVAAAVIGACIPKARAWVVDRLREARDAMGVLRSPRKLGQLYGGNMLSQLLFAITLGAAARAFGYSLPLSDLILVNTAVTLFAGLLPIPGGVGVMEAGLTLGLTRVGVPSEMAFPIALSYRFAVFYLPPIWGLLSFKWLTKHRYL